MQLSINYKTYHNIAKTSLALLGVLLLVMIAPVRRLAR